MTIAKKRLSGNALLILAVCILAAGSLTLTYARTAHRSAQEMLRTAQTAAQRAQSAQETARANQALVTSAERLRQDAGNTGVLPEQWGERLVSIRQQSVMRSEANQILLSTARHYGQVLKLDEFDLSVTQADEGLFDTPTSARQPVALTMRGMMHFRLSQ